MRSVKSGGEHGKTNDTKRAEVTMKIHSESRIHHPLEQVYACYRDKLPQIAPYTKDIREIIVNSREELAQGPKIHNIWVADRDIPKIAQGIVKPDMLRWDDFAQWNDDAKYVDWRLNIPAFPDQVKCSGRNAFFADGPDTTRVVLTGDLEINVKKIPGVPRLLAGRIAPKLEAFIVMLITPNLEKVNQSLELYLDDKSADIC
jgi:hypothetical protein